jgi:hypothetical protein
MMPRPFGVGNANARTTAMKRDSRIENAKLARMLF